MHAEVIAIGDELTSGQRLDTNTQWLSQQLGDLGIHTKFHTTVADDLAANIQAFQLAAQRVDFIICTGGLGPTADDLTRQAIAEAFGLSLELDEPSLAHIQNMFLSRGREMPERNRVQAMFPCGSQPIPNPHGTAPGVDLTVRKNGTCRIFSLPGVPAEMKEMWSETVRDALVEQLGHELQIVKHFRLKCFGSGESAVEAMLPDLIRRGREPSVGITVSQATITLRVSARAGSEEQCDEIMQPTIATIRECLGELVFGEEDDELQHCVSKMLLEKQMTLAIAEWGSSGLVSKWMSALPQADEVVKGGVIVTGRDAAAKMLGVAAELNSQDHTKAMAVAVREHCGADIGVAVGPFPSDPTNPDATVLIGFASENEVTVAEKRFAGHPDIQSTRTGKQVLDVVRKHLLQP